jgi:uncharacterized protein
MRLAAILHYPLKSGKAVELNEAELDESGIQNDRRLMIVDESGSFVTQYKLPKLALISVQIAGNEVIASALGVAPLVHTIISNGEQQSAKFYFDQVRVVDQGNTAAQWFSNFLGISCRLVVSQGDFGRNGPETSAEAWKGILPLRQARFTDIANLHLTTEASLADLNRHLEQPVPMNRFRPNLIVEGNSAFEEDRWKRLRIGDVELEGTLTSERCLITTTDQNTAERGKEPLRTLAQYRQLDGGYSSGVIFGIYLNVVRPGRIEVGQVVEVLETRPLFWTAV